MIKRKILFILEEGRFGGPQVYLINLINSISNRYDCLLSLPQKNSEKCQFMCKTHNIKFKLLAIETLSIKIKSLFFYCVFFLRDLITIWRHVIQADVDIVYIGGGSWQFKSVLATWLTKKKIVWHLNDTSMHPFILLIFRLVAKLSKNFIFASERTKRYYNDLITHKTSQIVIQSSVSIKFFTHRVKKKKHKIFKIVTVANINPTKGIDLLIEIAILASHQKLPFEFYIVGDIFETQAKYFKDLKRYIKNLRLRNMFFLGRSNNIIETLEEMDLYLCASKFESSPISVWEAMSLGMPIVSTDVGDVKIYLERYNAGVTYEQPNEAIMYLKRFFYNKIQFHKYGKGAKKCASENFTSIICAKKHELFFDQIYSNITSQEG